MLQRLINFSKNNPYFLIIIVFASVLRLYKISFVPPSLNWDEISHGYNAYSILKTGRDEWGEFLPIIFRAYGDYKLPAYIYLTAVSEFFFGLTPFAVRFVSVLAGIGTVIFTCLFVNEFMGSGFRVPGSKSLKNNALTRNKTTELTALIASLLVATEPWSFFLSRGAFEANLALFLFVSGMYFFIRSVNYPTTHYSLLTSSILFGLTLWTYNSYRIFTPLMFIALVLIYRVELYKVWKSNLKTIVYCLVISALFFLPMLYQFASGVGSARYEEVKIIDQGTIARIEEKRNTYQKQKETEQGWLILLSPPY